MKNIVKTEEEMVFLREQAKLFLKDLMDLCKKYNVGMYPNRRDDEDQVAFGNKVLGFETVHINGPNDNYGDKEWAASCLIFKDDYGNTNKMVEHIDVSGKSN